MLKVAVLGCTGQCGSCVVDELLSRGHSVLGISRNPPKDWNASPKYSSLSADINDTEKLAEIFSSGFDAIVCAYGPPLANLSKVYETCVESHGKIKQALLQSSHSGAFIVIGGAGSLHSHNRQQLVDQEEFAYSWWYTWPDAHLNYMYARTKDHGMLFFPLFIRGFMWARNNIQKPGWLSWLFRPLAVLYLLQAKKLLTSSEGRALITSSRQAFNMWQGVRDKSWSFLSPPGLLRDKGRRTGKYELHIDTDEDPAIEAVEGGIYNEDMAVAIVDEVENDKLAFQHWSCTGQIDLGPW